MDHRHYSPAGLSESELDESSSTASSPMSISSAEASSPYNSSHLNVDEDPTDSSFSTSVTSPSISSPPSSPAESICNNNYQWSSNSYFTGSKSVRWFRDDRGLWSERTVNRRNANSPYYRNICNTTSAKQQVENSNSNSHKEMSEVLIDAVQREDQAKLRHLLAKNAAHVNILGQEGDSPLHRSCRRGNLDTVKLLVSFIFETLAFVRRKKASITVDTSSVSLHLDDRIGVSLLQITHVIFFFSLFLLTNRFVTVPIRN